jgi:phosphoglycerol transferase
MMESTNTTPENAPKKNCWNTLGVYGAALGLCLAGQILVMELWHADLDVPFTYTGDGIFANVMAKTIIDTGWYLSNPNLGLPGSYEMYDFPMADNLHFFLMKTLSLTGLSFAAVVNLYFLLTFPLSTLTSLLVMRRFGISAAPAVVGSLLFAFLPYHFFRGTGHAFLASYYLVPLMVMVILWLYVEPCLMFSTRAGAKPRLALLAPKSAVSILVCVLVSSAGVYYAFFGCFLLLVAGLASLMHRRQIQVLCATGILIGTITAGCLANIAPGIVYTQQHGKNLAVKHTDHSQAEMFGLKISQMVLPLCNHRWPALAHLKQRYDSKYFPTEAVAATLGAVGTLGFLLLLVWFFYRRPSAALNHPLTGLALLNMAAVLLGTVGGLGALFALLINPSLRGYNRICVYIAFFSLFAVAWCLDKLAQKMSTSLGGRVLFLGLCGLILVLGILDQTNRDFVPAYASAEQVFKHDAEFVGRIERILPAGSPVFQLPYMHFPEAGIGPGQMQDYDHFRGYLHSRSLRWSYGAIHGREWDAWQATVGKKPLEEMLPLIAAGGFEGIWLDRGGYADSGAQAEATLLRLLNVEPVRSSNGRWLFFDLRQYMRREKITRAAQLQG